MHLKCCFSLYYGIKNLPLYRNNKKKEEKRLLLTFLLLPKLVIVLMIRTRATALSFSLLHDACVVTDADTASAFDKSKIQHTINGERNEQCCIKNRHGPSSAQQNLHLEVEKIKRANTKIKGRRSKCTIVEELIIFIKGPHSQYDGNLATVSRSSQAIFSNIINQLDSDEKNHAGTGCDG